MLICVAEQSMTCHVISLRTKWSPQCMVLLCCGDVDEEEEERENLRRRKRLYSQCEKRVRVRVCVRAFSCEASNHAGRVPKTEV